MRTLLLLMIVAIISCSKSTPPPASCPKIYDVSTFTIDTVPGKVFVQVRVLATDDSTWQWFQYSQDDWTKMNKTIGGTLCSPLTNCVANGVFYHPFPH